MPDGLAPASGERAGRCALYFCDWQFATTDGLEYLDPVGSQYKETLLLVAPASRRSSAGTSR
ncbi:hypothetical protein CO709_03280 [Burkholderia thailandensis]|uniref:hypothetical protein n=1 Tax=Burkholderia humptydooensis TaxID=430531 RepID=UPI0003A4DFBE|nr:hypothetical protein [Burkholderia humptydooensis]ATF32517.1 hypothetical protein CO709_03280 [Burkholderia thailandensis]KST70611.1 hypothetical protein WS76_18330 [Burkholderia humptydooensis]